MWKTWIYILAGSGLYGSTGPVFSSLPKYCNCLNLLYWVGQWIVCTAASLSHRPKISSENQYATNRSVYYVGFWKTDKWMGINFNCGQIQAYLSLKMITERQRYGLGLVFQPLNGICAWHISLWNCTVRQMSTQHENKTSHKNRKWVCQWQTHCLQTGALNESPSVCNVNSWPKIQAVI